MRRGHHRTKFATPKKGTKPREMILLMLRPQGATAKELLHLVNTQGQLNGVVHILRDYGGWDIRTFHVDNPDHDPNKPYSHRRLIAYRIVGRVLWNGGYRSFVDPD